MFHGNGTRVSAPAKRQQAESSAELATTCLRRFASPSFCTCEFPLPFLDGNLNSFITPLQLVYPGGWSIVKFEPSIRKGLLLLQDLNSGKYGQNFASK